jgi:hypothetical protein
MGTRVVTGVSTVTGLPTNGACTRRYSSGSAASRSIRRSTTSWQAPGRPPTFRPAGARRRPNRRFRRAPSLPKWAVTRGSRRAPWFTEVVHKRQVVAPRMTLSQISQNESPASARLLEMELAGLEPATSWVRSGSVFRAVSSRVLKIPACRRFVADTREHRRTRGDKPMHPKCTLADQAAGKARCASGRRTPSRRRPRPGRY